MVSSQLVTILTIDELHIDGHDNIDSRCNEWILSAPEWNAMRICEEAYTGKWRLKTFASATFPLPLGLWLFAVPLSDYLQYQEKGFKFKTTNKHRLNQWLHKVSCPHDCSESPQYEVQNFSLLSSWCHTSLPMPSPHMPPPTLPNYWRPSSQTWPVEVYTWHEWDILHSESASVK